MGTQPRAISEADKTAKNGAIVAAAEQLWLEMGESQFTMQRLADRLGMAKGTLYLYFQTKEEVLLYLYRTLLERWFELLRRNLVGRTQAESALVGQTGNHQGDSLTTLCATLAATMEEIAGLLPLAALLGSLLEKNIGYGPARDFKHWLLALMRQASVYIEEILPGLNAGDGFRILLFMQVFAGGLYPMCSPGPTIARVLSDDPELEPFRLDFKVSFTEALRLFVRGLLQASKDTICKE